MSEVVKEIKINENLFSEIEINGKVVKSAPQKSPTVSRDQDSSEQSSTGGNVNAVELNNIIHNIEDTVARRAGQEVQVISEQLNAKINQETEDRENADNLLQLSINAESELRVEGDSNLQSNIEAEASTRASADNTLQSKINQETEARTNADNTLQSNIEAEASTRASADNTLQTELASLNSLLSTIQSRVNELNALIPNTATEENQLADKDFVNSSIATNTANFIGTFNTLSELESQTATNNDYAFLRTADSLGAIVFKRYKYVADEGTWQYEYDLNNSSFTAEQWATINSGLTEQKVTDYDSHIADKSNPHSVTKAQVGLGSVVNTGDSATPVSGGTTKFTTGGAYTELNKKQDKLTSGINIKTINGKSVLGSGDLEISGNLPSGGTKGQVLTKTVDGADWENVNDVTKANSIRLSGANQATVVLGSESGELGRVTVNDVAHASNSDSASYVKDYNDNSNPIYVGYAGNGVTASEVRFLCAYKDANHLKDMSKAEVKTWLGLGDTKFHARINLGVTSVHEVHLNNIGLDPHANRLYQFDIIFDQDEYSASKGDKHISFLIHPAPSHVNRYIILDLSKQGLPTASVAVAGTSSDPYLYMQLNVLGASVTLIINEI